MRTKISWLLPCTLMTGVMAVESAPTEADKSAFLAREKMYVSFEVTVKGDRKFGEGTPANAITDGAYHRNRTVRGEIPLAMPMPGSFPLSSMPLGNMEMLEQGRFIGWMAMPPDDAGSATDLSKNPLFLPVESPSTTWSNFVTVTIQPLDGARRRGRTRVAASPTSQEAAWSCAT